LQEFRESTKQKPVNVVRTRFITSKEQEEELFFQQLEQDRQRGMKERESMAKSVGDGKAVHAEDEDKEKADYDMVGSEKLEEIIGEIEKRKEG